MTPQTLKVFLEGLKVLNLKLDGSQLNRFSVYLDELKKWNESFNLIGPASDEEIVKRHFLDSLSVLPAFRDSCLPFSASVLDIGTGAGFPGIPLKIALPGISLTLLDSSKKKTEFLRHLCKKLDVKAEIICAPAESAAGMPEHKNNYDVVVARAVAKMSTAERISMPFLKKDGVLILQAGEKTDIKLKYGEIMKKFSLPEKILPGRTILSIKKKSAGFTLIELMLVVAVIGILASIAIPKFAEMMRRTKQGKTKGELGNLRSALTLYYSDQEGMLYPQSAAAISGAAGPFQTKYLSRMPTVKLGLPGHMDTVGMDDFADGDVLTDEGNWGYTSLTGIVFVNCTHLDTSGNLISSW